MIALLAAADPTGGIDPGTIAAYVAILAAVLTPLATGIATSRRTGVEQELPRLRSRVDELETARESDRIKYGARIDELEDEVTELRRYVYDLRQDVAATGQDPRPIPAKLRLATERREVP